MRWWGSTTTTIITIRLRKRPGWRRQAEQPGYTHYRIDLADKAAVERVFAEQRPQRVVNLAAQAGVRHSIDHPLAFIDSNIVGFAQVLEGCRQHGVEHLVYASSSSVYGANTAMPYSIHHNVDHPLSLYAASKKANELMAHTYSHLFGLPTTGLRFFTVYGPWDRPDMALARFARAIMADEPIKVYNHGKHRRDFTYIDDIIEGVVRVLDKPAAPNPDWSGDDPDPGSSSAPWRLYNIGNNRLVELLDYIAHLERALGKTAKRDSTPAARRRAGHLGRGQRPGPRFRLPPHHHGGRGNRQLRRLVPRLLPGVSGVKPQSPKFNFATLQA
ncbi:MAG: NAD-dependent epimerase/dehydratase family protein [Desulfurivibrio sp.]|nr:NAD-dependent epimerase/dehydratase family protein [Desulfurivibrio sp.]